jgi:D-alanyl-D-alanine carboxypeptidase
VISATSAELYNATSGKTLYSLSPDASLPMASTTKIMTAVVALTYGKLDQPITVGPDVVAIEDGGTSVAGLQLGETLSLRELLYCLMLPSGDDAAIAIADGIAGSQSSFVALMNLEAGLLGLSHTHYANPHGLDAPDHFTSVSDLVRLTEYAMKSPTFAQVVATPNMTLPATATHHEFKLVNTNELLQTEPFAYDGAIGIKTGFTGPAGYCLVFMAKRPSGVLIGAVLGDSTYDGRFTDATALLNWAYTALSPAPTATATASASPSATAPAASATATP